MPLDFPSNPAAQTPVDTFSPSSTPDASTNGVTYTWDGVKWDAAGIGDYVLKTGDTMTGDLTVPNITVPGTITAAQAPAVMCNFGVIQSGVITIYASINVDSVVWNNSPGQYRVNFSTPLTNSGVSSVTASSGLAASGASFCNIISSGPTNSLIGTLSAQANGTLAPEASNFYNFVLWDV